jgi:hypothetical protein
MGTDCRIGGLNLSMSFHVHFAGCQDIETEQQAMCINEEVQTRRTTLLSSCPNITPLNVSWITVMLNSLDMQHELTL